MPAGDFFAFCLFPLYFLGEIACLGGIGFLIGLLRILVLARHAILLLKSIDCEIGSRNRAWLRPAVCTIPTTGESQLMPVWIVKV
jgi:hypothetical protein